MAGLVKISELPTATTLGATDIFPIVQSGTTKKIAASLITTTTTNVITETITTLQEIISTNVPLGNGYLAATIAANAITIKMLTLADTDPTATDAITVVLRNATISSGDITAYTVTGALYTIISSGSTLGCGASEKVRIHVGAMLNDAGTAIELCYWTAAVAASTGIKRYDPTMLISTTAEGASGAADSAQTLYATNTRTSRPWQYLGYIEVTSSATAGVWSSVDKIVNWNSGIPMPGDWVGGDSVYTGAVSTGSTQLPADDSIPEITEGDQVMSLAYTPRSIMNFLRRTAQIYATTAQANSSVHCAMFEVGTTNALRAGTTAGREASPSHNPCSLKDFRRAGATSELTTTVRIGPATGGNTVTFNGVAGARVFGGVDNSYIEIEEFHV